MNYAFLPDLSALTILIILLVLLRKRHPQEQVNMWLLGLFFTLVEAIAHIFYAPAGPPSTILHVVVMDCYLLTGIVFVWASGDIHRDNKKSRRSRLIYIAWNTLPLFAMATAYGMHLFARGAFLPCVIAGLGISVVTTFVFKRGWIRAILFACGWLAVGFLVSRAYYRDAVYWSLGAVYSVAWFNFKRRLPTPSTGRVAILTGFFIWAAFFFIHPLIVQYRTYADIASHIWNMQKSLISIGMILVLLEEQVSNNRWLALHDELTGLANRRSFENQLTASLERLRRSNRQLAVFLLDLNGFKQINDSFGHHAGDEVLRAVACRLRDDVYGCETLARLGGDEFTMIACDVVGRAAGDRHAEAIQAVVERPILVDGRTMTVSACVGIALFPQDGQEATKLLRIADQRMYMFKQRPAQRPMAGELTPTPSL
jgi:diguanylate cyclase (GGDEF)-like protein